MSGWPHVRASLGLTLGCLHATDPLHVAGVCCFCFPAAASAPFERANSCRHWVLTRLRVAATPEAAAANSVPLSGRIAAIAVGLASGKVTKKCLNSSTPSDFCLST